MTTRYPGRHRPQASLRGALSLGVAVGALVMLALPAAAADTKQVSPEDMQKLLDIVSRQNKQIETQKRLLEAQDKRLQQLEHHVRGSGSADPKRAVYRPPAAKTRNGASRAAQAQQQSGQTAQETVGKEEKKKNLAREEVAGVYEAGGVLTAPGTVIVEPSIEYSQSNINRFFFQGLEVVETVLIGQIEATDSDRDSYVARATVRTGITDRSEAEVRVPFVYRDDRITNQIVSTQTSTTRDLDGRGLGDVEGTVRYQINDGLEDWPIFIGSLRGKSTTGEGPFEVGRDVNGIETELPTGSGFWGVEPGVTMLYGSDPAVFWVNSKYLFHLGRDVDETIGGNLVGEVDPGDVLSVSFGMGIGLNERTSFSLGYEHNFIGKTETEINGASVESNTLDVGSLLFGFSHALSERVSLNLSVQAGVTEDAPDVVMTFRVPVKFNVAE